MINNIFAKLLGTILEKKLGSWAEENNLRALSQAGFRQHQSGIDHLVALRYCIDTAKGQRKRTFICFVDFSKAFDSVDRGKLWKRLQDVQTPPQLLQAIQRLYAKVLIQLKNCGTPESATLCSSIGVKQGCPLSLTLFGIFIDSFETWMEEVPVEHGIIVGSLVLHLLLFADDVALISKIGKGLQNMLQVLDKFCIYSGLKVNVAKTKVMVCGTRTQIPTFYIGDKQVENVTIYKYLGVEFSSNYKWGECISQRIASGMKALYALRNKCKKEGILSCEIRRKLFRAIIQPVVLYGSVVWSPGLPVKWWKAIENVQKQFLIGEFKVKQQVQYDILLLEADLLPLEVEALYQFISYTQQ